MMRKNILAAAVLAVIIPQTAFADVCSYDVERESVEFSISGSSRASVIVYSENNSEYVFVKELEPENNILSDIFRMPDGASSGSYIISSVSGTEESRLGFRHINKSQSAAAVKAIENAQESNLKALIRDNADVLGIDLEYFENHGDEVAGYFCALKPKTLDAVSFWNNYHYAVLLDSTSGINDYSAIDEILRANADFIDFDYDAFSKYPDKVKNEVYKRFSDAKITEDGFLNMIDIWTALARLNNTGSWDVYRNLLLTEYGALFEIDKTMFNTARAEDIIREIMNRNGGYQTKESLVSAYSAACAKYRASTQGGGGTSSGGTSSGGGNVSIPYTQPTATEKYVFFDIPDTYWAASIISELNKKGIVNGSGGNFYPEDSITRAEFCTMIVQAFYREQAAGNAVFDDVSPSDWFGRYIALLADRGIICGRGDGKFYPYDLITREDMAVIADRCIDDLQIEMALKRNASEFADSGDIAQYSRAAVERLYCGGVISGMPNGLFMPKAKLSRAEAAAVIYGLLNISEVTR